MSSVDIQSSEATMRQEESREPPEETRTAVEEAQAPSGWETLNPEPGTPEEKPKTEEEQAQTTLDALEEIPKIMEEVSFLFQRVITFALSFMLITAISWKKTAVVMTHMSG